MKLAFYKYEYGTLIDKLIAAFSHSQFSHVELVLDYNPEGESLCFSSSNRDRGVRQKMIDVNTGSWYLVDLYSILTMDKIVTLKKVCESYANHGYDWPGVISFPFGSLLSLPWLYQCAEVIMEVFYISDIVRDTEIGFKLTDKGSESIDIVNPKPSKCSPGRLLECVLLEMDLQRKGVL